MIKTQDDHFVTEDHPVFEIRYTWYNAEISLAEPYQIAAGLSKGPVWLYRFPCYMRCLEINRANRFVDLEEPISTVKMIANAHSS